MHHQTLTYLSLREVVSQPSPCAGKHLQDEAGEAEIRAKAQSKRGRGVDADADKVGRLESNVAGTGGECRESACLLIFSGLTDSCRCFWHQHLQAG